MARKKKTGTNKELVSFNRIAKENNLTYGQLQALETKGQVKVMGNQLSKRNKEGVMSNYTRETRRESFEKLDSESVKRHIIEILRCGTALTAREIAMAMYEQKIIPYPVRQAVAPRLTELEAAEVVETVGKVFDEETKRNVAAYKLIKFFA